MTKNQENEFKKQFEEQLQRQFTRGLSQGSKAMCGVILDKIKGYNENNTISVIRDIEKFCKMSLGLPDIR